MATIKDRTARIHAEIPIAQVLADLGYEVHPNGGHREQQFPCDLHGDGQDGKPSARLYPDSNSWYCIDVEELVLTRDGGWKPLKALQTRLEPILDGVGEWNTPVAYLDRGIRPCVRVTTSAGLSVTLTADHEVATRDRGWVPAEDLRLGDLLVQVLPAGQSQSLPEALTLPFEVSDLKFHPRVTAIVPVGDRHVADLAMPGDPSFAVNSLKVHNCFACAQARDAIATYREVKRLSFIAAIQALERDYELPALPWDDETPEKEAPAPPAIKAESLLGLDEPVKIERLIEQIRSRLSWITQDRVLTMKVTASLWTVFDMITVLQEGGTLPEPKASSLLLGLNDKIDEALTRGAYEYLH